MARTTRASPRKPRQRSRDETTCGHTQSVEVVVSRPDARARFDADIDGAVATPLKASAKQLASDLGYLAA